ncbi:MAG: DUF488 family protein [Chitinivibrionales bacterium]|nr:DUF488 family protein [Chitinivibrionales bacterium]
MNELYTIGHSTHTIERLVELLRLHGIGAVGDVRSSPFSRFNPQFNREPLQQTLREAAIEYVFLGNELGARPRERSCYVDGKVQFTRVARLPSFARGLERLRVGMDTYRTTLLCAEKDPIGCHRMILVCRALRSGATKIRHILEDGTLEENDDTELRLMRELDIRENDLFASVDEQIERAYDQQASRIAYAEGGDNA